MNDALTNENNLANTQYTPQIQNFVPHNMYTQNQLDPHRFQHPLIQTGNYIDPRMIPLPPTIDPRMIPLPQTIDPRMIPLPPTVVTQQHQHHQLPSVASVSSNSTMSSRQSYPPNQQSSHQSQNFDMIMNTLIENQKQMQELQRQLIQIQMNRHTPSPIQSQLSSHVPKTESQHEPPPADAQTLFFQQMLQTSRAQQDFFQKTEISASPKFPKFSGKSSSDFTSWYEQILSILAIPPWQKLYDPITNDVVEESDQVATLSQKLYSSLQISMQGEAQTIMRSKSHLRGKGLSYLKALKSIYKHKLSKVELITKETEYNSLFRKTDESIDSFAARCVALQQELRDNGSFVSQDGFRTRFIRGLGPDFSDVQKQLDNLPPEWDTFSIDELLNTARKHLHNVLAIRSNNRLHKEQNKPAANTPDQNPPKSNDKKKSTKQSDTKHEPPNTNIFRKRISQDIDVRAFIKKNEERQFRIQEDLIKGTYLPSKYEPEVKSGYCIWHNTKSHNHLNCDHINALLHKYPNQPTAPTLPEPSAKHTSIAKNDNMQEAFEDIDLSELQQATDDLLNFNNKLNKINDNVSNYLKITCNHVHLSDSVQLSHSTPKLNNKQMIQFIVDSGAYPHMSNDPKSFQTFTKWPREHKIQKVSMADGKTKAQIHGIGSIQCIINNNNYTIRGVLYVPELSKSLYSVKQHCETQGQIIHFEANKAILSFPTFIHAVPIQDEIFLNVHIIPPTKTKSSENDAYKVQSLENENSINDIPTFPIENKLKISYRPLSPDAKTPQKGTSGSAGFDIYSSKPFKIEPNQRIAAPTDISMAIPFGYYGRIASRSGLTMHHSIDIGAGVIDSDYRGEIKPILINNGNKTVLFAKHDKIAQIIIEKCADVNFEQIEQLNTTDRDQKGFGSTDTLKSKRVKPFLKNEPTKITIKLPWKDYFERGSLLINGPNAEFTSTDNQKQIIPLQKANEMKAKEQILMGHNHKIRIPPSSENSPKLRLVDKPLQHAPHIATLSIDQLKKGFGFRNIQSIIKELQQTSSKFRLSTLDKEPILDLGEVATIDRSKRNTTLLDLPRNLGDVVHMDILFGSNTAINGIKYALFIVDKATRFKYIYPLKNLKVDILPAIQKFSIDIQTFPKCIRTDFDHKLMGRKIEMFATENHCTIESAPPEHQSINGLCERNWRTLLKMARSWLASSLLPNKFWYFALQRAAEVSNYIPIKVDNILTTPHELAYKCKPDMRNIFQLFAVAYITQSDQHSYNNQTIRTILVGRSPKTNTLLFYHPQTQKTISSARCTIDETLVAGPTFGFKYEGGLHVHKYCDSTEHFKVPTYKPHEHVQVQQNEQVQTAHILTLPAFDDTVYTVQFQDGSIHQVEESQIQHKIQNTTTYQIPSWIKNDSPVTAYLHSMPRPQRGRLVNKNDTWYFRPGYKDSNKLLEIPNFIKNLNELLNTKCIQKGHISIQQALLDRSSHALSNIIARHVSATGLQSHDVPTLLQHHKLSENDRKIWHAAYEEEFYGLTNLPAWSTLTEQEYQSQKQTFKTILPTMAISTIKYDEWGKPKRAKYRIVALGNMDPHDWSKQDCYAPVMSMLELRLLIAIAIKHRKILKSGDFKQAFIQAILPPNEKYVLKPPVGCPISQKNTYWLLERTIYGLKRSPRHWYDKAVSILHSLGLQKCPNAPCLFKGTIIPNRPPLYLGLYVDDFVFFSEDEMVEKQFEQQLKSKTNVDFMGNVTHFLGLRFQWRQQQQSLQVHLSQEAFADNLIQQAGLDQFSTKSNLTPFRSGNPVDSIPTTTKQNADKSTEMRSYVGSLLWLSLGTRPDLSTITNILAKYQNNPSPQHIAAAKYAIKYLKGTKHLGITFSSTSQNNDSITSFLNFPVHTPQVGALCDANWGPQDQSISKSNMGQQLELFKSRSISGHIITLFGPIAWSSKRQTITARSSAEAEIYATDECVKQLLHIRNIIQDLGLEKQLMQKKMKIYNDNMACVMWTSNKTSKGLRYIQIRENATKENIHLFDIQHIAGKVNIADIFSKEVKDQQHFVQMRDIIVQPPFPQKHIELIQQHSESKSRLNTGPHTTSIDTNNGSRTTIKAPTANSQQSQIQSKQKNSMIDINPETSLIDKISTTNNANGAGYNMETSPKTTSTNYQSVKLTKKNQSVCSSFSFDNQNYENNPNFSSPTNDIQQTIKTYKSILLSNSKNSRQKQNNSIGWNITKLTKL